MTHRTQEWAEWAGKVVAVPKVPGCCSCNAAVSGDGTAHGLSCSLQVKVAARIKGRRAAHCT